MQVKDQFLCVLILGLVSCSSPQYLKKTKSTDQKIQTINLAAVRFFSPDYEVSEFDDFSNLNRKFNCEATRSFWADFLKDDRAKNLIDCLNSLGETKAYYRYRSKVKPELEIDPFSKEESPACLKKILPLIPLPREVFFLGKKEGESEQHVFAMGLNTQTNLIVDAELRVPRFSIHLPFPLVRKLESKQDLELWFLSTTLTLFKSSEGIFASAVPELTYKQCFKEDPLFKDKKSEKIPPLFWP